MEPETNKTKALSKEETKGLLSLIEGSNIINNKKTNATSNKLKVEEWSRIADSFNASIGICRRTPQQLRLKWENLKKNSRKRSTAIRMERIKKPRKTVKKERPASENDDDDDDEDDKDGEDEEEVAVIEGENEDAVATIIIKGEPADEPPSPKMAKPRLTRVLKRKLICAPRHENGSSSRFVEYPKVKYIKKTDEVRKKDECDSFGEYIAISLRKHDERTQAMIKQAINNILFEQEMKKYNTSQFTVVLAGLEENPLMDNETEK